MNKTIKNILVKACIVNHKVQTGLMRECGLEKIGFLKKVLQHSDNQVVLFERYMNGELSLEDTILNPNQMADWAEIMDTAYKTGEEVGEAIKPALIQVRDILKK